MPSAVLLISPKGRRQRGIDHPNVYQIVPSLLDGLDGPNDALTKKTRMDIFSSFVNRYVRPTTANFKQNH